MELEKSDQIAWRKFLATDAGREGLLFLHEGVPGVARGDGTQIIFDAGRIEGYRECLRKITEVIAIQQVNEPRIEND